MSQYPPKGEAISGFIAGFTGKTNVPVGSKSGTSVGLIIANHSGGRDMAACLHLLS